jgi:hypothetical protein
MLNQLSKLVALALYSHAVNLAEGGGAAQVDPATPAADNAVEQEATVSTVSKHINPDKINVDDNPFAQDVEAQIQGNFVVMEKVKFSFRTTEILDPAGDKTYKDGEHKGKKYREWKRPTLEVELPLVVRAGVIGALEANDKTTELLVDAARDIQIARARGILQDKIETDPTITLTADDIPLDQLSLAAIASLPKSARGAGIPKEAIQAFIADYKQTLQRPEAIALFSDKNPRAPDVLERHAILIAGKFNQIKARQDLAAQMAGFLDVWLQVSDAAEEHVKVYSFMKEKLDAIVKGDSYDDL